MPAKIIAASTLIAAALLVSLPTASEARIACDREFQLNREGAIATPGCADRYLAQVARSYGMKVSYVDVRSPAVKQRVCEFVGNDIRLQSICSGWRNDNAGGVRTR